MIDGLLPYESAAREAYEEAGLIGKIDRTCFGWFDYARANASGKRSCEVGVYPLMVYKQVTKWPEMSERKVTRCDVSTALALISVPDLVRLIGDYLQRHHLVANSGA
jgi:8-oxo-dGTP pyrophosphatase MutT (NUDIX family)